MVNCFATHISLRATSDYDDEELDADIAADCGAPAAAFFECVLDHTCEDQVKKECRDQEDALTECRFGGG